MPASKYKGAQRRAYFATDGWTKPAEKRRKREKAAGKAQKPKMGRRGTLSY